MAITPVGERLKGDSFADLEEYLRMETEAGYPVSSVVQSRCRCGTVVFRVRADAAEGCAERTCSTFGTQFLIADRAEFWDDAGPEQIECPCGHDQFEVGVGFSMRASVSTEVKWITVGLRCVNCGLLGISSDWKIDYMPSQHLLTLA